VWRTLTQRERASNVIVLAADHHVGALDLGRGGEAVLDIGLSLAEVAMRSPDEIADDIFILSIGTKDCTGISSANWP